MRQRSHIKLPDTITVNRLAACGKKVAHGNNGDSIMPGAIEFGSFLFRNSANIGVMVFQSLNELGVFIVDSFSRFDCADILIA